MLLISWNVASLSTTLQRIDQDYRAEAGAEAAAATAKDEQRPRSITSSSSSSSNHKHKNSSIAFSHFLKRHGDPDILCIQEHKIPHEKLSSRSEPYNCTSITGYESFWSCCTSSDRKGFNGVVTFCKKGITRSASSLPFPDDVCRTSSGSDNSNDNKKKRATNANANISLNLNAQGRCIMTDHGKFVIFNVYAPASTSSNPMWHKMKFLIELRKCMNEQRVKYNKQVLLVGDLNISRSGLLDRHWRFRSIHVDYVLGEVEDERRRQQKYQDGQEKSGDGGGVEGEGGCLKNNDSERNANYECCDEPKSAPTPLPEWKIQLATHWGKIQKSLSTIEILPITTEKMSTGSTNQKYRSRVTIVNNSDGNHSDSNNDNNSSSNNGSNSNNNNRRKVYIGKTEAHKEDCLYNFTFPQYTYYDHDLEKEMIQLQANVVPITTLHELMSKIANVHWDERTLSSMANCSVQSGIVDEMRPHVNWLNRELLADDGMVDAFRLLHPTAKGRFTCWDQRTNSRFENMGARIDYTIVDKAIVQYITPDGSNTNNNAAKNDQGPRLRSCNYNSSDKDFNSEEAALHAATASGLFQGASVYGGGIAQPSKKALDSQFGDGEHDNDDAPHTGIIYTPPSYSDHVAVSLYLNSKWDEEYVDTSLELNTKCPLTKKAQPHKSQTSISSFFGKGVIKNGISTTKHSLTSTPSLLTSSLKLKPSRCKSKKPLKRKSSNESKASSSQKKKVSIQRFFQK